MAFATCRAVSVRRLHGSRQARLTCCRMQHVEREALEDGLEEIRRSPRESGTVELIVRRPSEEEREVLAEAQLDPVQGVVGDRWHGGGSRAPRQAADADERARRRADRADPRTLAPRR